MDYVIGDLAHHVDLELVIALFQTVLRHRRDHLLGFGDTAAKWDHDAQVLQPHFVADARQRPAFERETIGIGRVGVAGRPAKPEHWILFFWFELGAADQVGIFIGLEIRQPHDDGPRIKGSGDRTDPLRKLVDKEIGWLRVGLHQAGNGGLCLFRCHLFRMDERHRMDTDVLIDNELHSREPNAVVGQHRGVIGKLGIAEIDHDLRARARQRVQRDPDHLERQLPVIHLADLAIRAADSYRCSGGKFFNRVLCADDGR